MSDEFDKTFDIEDDELADNPTKRVPVCLCLDTSSSMGGNPIHELNEGVRLFYEEINDDEVAKSAADVCIVTFGYGGVSDVQDFQSIDGEVAPSFHAGGDTPMGAGITRALNLLEKRKQEYKDNGTEYFQPWLVLITDGAPTDDISQAASKTSQMARDKKLTIFPLAVEGADMDTLRRISPVRQPVKLQGMKFKEFFQWLSKSISVVSHSKPGETISLPSNDDWATL